MEFAIPRGNGWSIEVSAWLVWFTAEGTGTGLESRVWARGEDMDEVRACSFAGSKGGQGGRGMHCRFHELMTFVLRLSWAEETPALVPSCASPGRHWAIRAIRAPGSGVTSHESHVTSWPERFRPLSEGVGQGRLVVETGNSFHYLTHGVMFGGRCRTDNTKPALANAYSSPLSLRTSASWTKASCHLACVPEVIRPSWGLRARGVAGPKRYHRPVYFGCLTFPMP